MLLWVWFVGCAEDPVIDPVDTDDVVDTDVADTDVAPDPYDHSDDIGAPATPFALIDLNPASPTAGQTVSTESLAGRPYGLIFLASECLTVREVADDLWAAYAANPTWWDAYPVFAIESSWSFEGAPDGVGPVVDGNALPYLLDTEPTDLWGTYGALNHDFFGISADGKIEVWLPLYAWPGDRATIEGWIATKAG